MIGNKTKERSGTFNGSRERDLFMLMVLAIAIVVTYTAVHERRQSAKALDIMNNETATVYSIRDRSTGKIRMLVAADSIVIESGSGYQEVEGTSLTWPTAGQRIKAVLSGNTVRLVSYDDLFGLPVRRRDRIRNAGITAYDTGR